MPKIPKKAKDASKEKGGQITEVKPLQGEKGKYNLGSQKVGKASPDETEQSTEEETHKINIKLKNDANKPVSTMPSGGSVIFHIKVEGETYEGSLDDKGEAEITGLPNQPCDVSFPEIDKNEWKKA
jgi:hypothetical protein